MSDEPKFTQADIDSAVEKAVGDLKGLKESLDKALDEAKDAKRKLRAASEISPEDVQKLEEQIDTLKADLTKAQKEAKDATTAKEKAETALTAETGFNSRLLIENGLNSALAEAGVTEPELLKAAKAMMAGGATIATEGDDRVVKFGDKALADHVKEWAATDGAKHFKTAPHNAGGGAAGGAGGGSGDKNPWAKDSVNLTEQSRLYREDPAKATELAKAAGVTLAA